MAVETVTMYRMVCDVCGYVGKATYFPTLCSDGWEEFKYRGHKLNHCIAHRYGFTPGELDWLDRKYPDPA